MVYIRLNRAKNYKSHFFNVFSEFIASRPLLFSKRKALGIQAKCIQCAQ